MCSYRGTVPLEAYLNGTHVSKRQEQLYLSVVQLDEDGGDAMRG